MKGTIIKIGKLLSHRDGLYMYYPISIRLENRKVVLLHLIPSYSNYPGWSWLLEAGEKTVIDGIVLVEKYPKFVNKDYYPVLVSTPKQKQATLL
jgi:hypothetical protein